MLAASRRGLFRIHAWIGLNLGLLLFVICFSGTVAVFSAELSWLADPALRVDPPPAAERQPLSWQAMHDRVSAAHPHGRILSLHAPQGPRFAATALLAYGPDDYRIVLIDPHTGALQGHRSSLTLASFLRVFHKQLYVVPTQFRLHGTLIVGALAVPLLLAALTGIVSVRRWWRALVTLRAGRSARLFWSDLHRLSGLWSLLVTMLLCLTGIWYLAENILESTGLLADEPRPPRLQSESLRAGPADLLPLDLDTAAAGARAAYPELVITQLRLPVRPGDTLGFSGQAEAWLVRDRANAVQMDPYTGAILQIRRATDLAAFPRWIETADLLHFGTFGGLASRILWVIAGLLLSAGILAGLYGAWLRLRRDLAPGSRPRIAALGVVLPTLLLLLASVYGAWAYGGGFARRAQRPVEIVPLAEIAVGARRASVIWVDPAQTDTAAITVGIVFTGAAQPNFRQARLWLDGVDPVAQMPVPQRLLDRVSARLPLPPDRCAAGCRLTLAIEDWTGRREQASVTIRPDAAAIARSGQTLPVARGMTMGEIAVLTVFMLCLVLPCLAWIGLQWRLAVRGLANNS